MTLREKILELLKQGPKTSNSLASALRVDRKWVKNILFIMERQGLVTCKPKKRGKVLYKFWRID